MSPNPDVLMTTVAGVALALLIFGTLYMFDFFRRLHKGDWMRRAQFYNNCGFYWKYILMPALFIGLLFPLYYIPSLLLPMTLLLIGQIGWNLSNVMSGFSLNRQAQILQELSFALAKGMPAGDFLLRAAADQRGMIGLALHAVSVRLSRGESLHSALEQEQIFPTHVRHALKAGELGGGALLPQLAHEQARELRRRSDIGARFFLALALPCAVLPFLALTVLLSTKFIHPKIQYAFEVKGAELPRSTQILEWISQPLLWILLVGMLLGFWLFALFRSEGLPRARGLFARTFLRVCYAIGLRLPFVGSLLIHRGIGRAWRVILALTQGGRPLPEACLAAGQENVAGPHAARFKRLGQALQRGDPLAQALDYAGLDAPDASLLQAGAYAGEFAPAMETVAEWHETRATKYAMQLGLLVPVGATLAVGALVGLTAVGAYEPIFTQPNLMLRK